jgi:hypothetical protein
MRRRPGGDGEGCGQQPGVGRQCDVHGPGFGASGLFSNSTTTITVATNASGVASAPFTANATAGGPYTVTAAVAGLTTGNFSLTNIAAGLGGVTPVPTLGFGALLMLATLLGLLAFAGMRRRR